MHEMKLHDIGEGMTEGEVVQILVQVGDFVDVDQPVIEVQTDKVCAELSAPVGGKVTDILVKVGEVITVGSTMLKIEAGDHSQSKLHNHSIDHSLTEQEQLERSELSFSDTSSSKEQTSSNKQINSNYDQPTLLTSDKHPETKSAAAGSRSSKNVKAAPYTRRLAREYGIEIETVQGTGPNGRITVEDIENRNQHVLSRETLGEVAISTASRDLHIPELNKETLGNTISSAPKIIPFSGRRKQIAKKMTQSMFTIPHVTHFDKIDMTALLELKDQYQQEFGKRTGILRDVSVKEERLSMIAFITKAITISLLDFPIFNAKLDEKKGEIRLEPHVNIGIAVNTDEGLVVPVIPNAEELSIYELNKQMKALTKRAQQNELKASDLRGGTFTISNVGPIGGMFATPIINHPEVALLAFHQLEDMPVVRNKEIVIRSMLNFSMSFDHRVADGVTAVQFTNRMKELLEFPMNLFVHLK